jgi:hypothetical protein
MKSRYTLALTLAACLLFAYSCKDDDATPVTTQDQDVCDTLDVSYNSVVKAVIDNNCATDYCHGGAGAGNVFMANYTETKTVASQGRFLKAIKHQPGASPMPKDKAQLSDGEITILECWVQNGFKEN